MEKERKKKKLSKFQLRAIIIGAVSLVFALAFIITNIFIPVKYLASYMVARNRGAAEGVMRVRFVDAGYGDCIIVELPDGKNMLIDGGNGSAPNQAKILKYLNSCDINTIDYLICTSVKSEHCGGLAEIIKYKTVNKIYMPYCLNTFINDKYRDFALAARDSGAPVIISQYGAGGKNTEYGYFFSFLSPSIISNPEGEYAELNKNGGSEEAVNNSSAVIWLEYAGTAFLFTSDAGSKVLNGICNSYAVAGEDYPVKLENCTVISVSGHGSADSSAQLYDTAKPEVAVISVGENGRGCPSAAAIADAANCVGDNLYRTDGGAVTIEVNKEGYKII